MNLDARSAGGNTRGIYQDQHAHFLSATYSMNASDKGKSSQMEAGEATQQSLPAAASGLFNLEGVERLIVRSDPTIKSYIPFGIEGTSVIISPYGEILRMSQYVDEEDPRIICLASPSLEFYQRDLWGIRNFLHLRAQVPRTGLGIHLESEFASGNKEPSFETRLEWLNGRWPCIYYELNGLAISVAFTVRRGVLSQQYVLVNQSEKDVDIRYDLQVGQCEVYTLYIDGKQVCTFLGNLLPDIFPQSRNALIRRMSDVHSVRKRKETTLSLGSS